MVLIFTTAGAASSTNSVKSGKDAAQAGRANKANINTDKATNGVDSLTLFTLSPFTGISQDVFYTDYIIGTQLQEKSAALYIALHNHSCQKKNMALKAEGMED